MRIAETIRLPNMTPLVAVIAAMLFVFQAYGSLNPGCRHDTIEEPISSNRQATTEMPDKCMLIHVIPDPEYVGTMRGVNYANVEDLSRDLERQKSDTPDFHVVIRADRSTPYERVSTIMEICRDAHIENVSLLAKAW